MSKEIFQRFSDRFIQLSPLLTEPGWYAKLRGGDIIGPFSTKSAARIAIFNLIGVAFEVNEQVAFHIDDMSMRYSQNSRSS